MILSFDNSNVVKKNFAHGANSSLKRSTQSRSSAASDVYKRQKLLGILFLNKEDSGKYRPLEINFDNLRVSFEKGCYRGQEIVARMKYLGINRRKFCTFTTGSDFNEFSKIKILGDTVKLKEKKIFNAIVKRDELDEIKKLSGIIDID